jgi:hypothetical protein
MLVLAGTVFLVSPQPKRVDYAIASAIFFMLLSPLFFYMWNQPEVSNYRLVDWITVTFQALLVLCGFFAIDAVIGLAAFPELPILAAATNHIGFTITACLSPLLLVGPVSMLRHVFLTFLRARN